MADWSLLPNDLLELIVGRLELSFQIVLFLSVCNSWRSVAPRQESSRGLRNKTHIDFDFCFSSSDEPLPLYDEYCTLKKIPIFLIRFQTPFGGDFLLAEMRARKYGKPMLMSSPLSCNGLTYLRYQKLFNSLSSQIIPFGHYYEITYYEERYRRYHGGSEYIRDVEKISGRAEFLNLGSKDCRDFVVLGIKINVLVMFRSRDLSWTKIVDHPKTYCSYQDIAAFKGKFYAVDRSGWGQVFAIELSLKVTEIPSVRGHQKSSQERLVKSGEELLLVQQFIPGWCHSEDMYTWFRVFRLDEGGGKRKWVQVNDLNDRVILLGSRINLCCSVQKLPGAKKNCIVFIDWSETISDNESILLFDLKTKRTSTAFSECRGYMGAFGLNLESLVNCGVVTMPNYVENVYDETFF